MSTKGRQAGNATKRSEKAFHFSLAGATTSSRLSSGLRWWQKIWVPVEWFSANALCKLNELYRSQVDFNLCRLLIWSCVLFSLSTASPLIATHDNRHDLILFAGETSPRNNQWLFSKTKGKNTPENKSSIWRVFFWESVAGLFVFPVWLFKLFKKPKQLGIEIEWGH